MLPVLFVGIVLVAIMHGLVWLVSKGRSDSSFDIRTKIKVSMVSCFWILDVFQERKIWVFDIVFFFWYWSKKGYIIEGSFVELTEFWIRFRRTIAFFDLTFLKIKKFRWVLNRKYRSFSFGSVSIDFFDVFLEILKCLVRRYFSLDCDLFQYIFVIYSFIALLNVMNIYEFRFNRNKYLFL